MRLFKKATDITEYLLKIKEQGKAVGFVPTMGALHDGHVSLLRNAKANSAVSVCSIFVNPTQFNDIKDFTNYPVTIEKDIDFLEKAGCDVLFLPAVTEMYPKGTENTEKYELGYLETVLEGRFRPGHFQGVCMVVHRLLNIIPADTLYLGQKDYQQCMVVKKLIRLKDINTKIIICPTLREKDGLAMSSRNVRLTGAHRKKAIQISENLSFLKKHITPGDVSQLKNTAIQNLAGSGFKIDYLEIANAETLEILNTWDGIIKTVAVAAAFLGDVRLIDNMLLQD
jgi:pantoate--beta-alanine ligase